MVVIRIVDEEEVATIGAQPSNAAEQISINEGEEVANNEAQSEIVEEIVESKPA